MAGSIPYNLLGFTVSGDLAGITIYTDRWRRKIFYPAAPPIKPPTQLQLFQRQQFRNAAKLWRSLTTADRRNLSACCRKLSLPVTGPSLWCCLCQQPTDNLLATLSRQSALPLPNWRAVAIGL